MEEHILEAMEMRMLRRIMGVTQLGKKRSEDIRKDIIVYKIQREETDGTDTS